MIKMRTPKLKKYIPVSQFTGYVPGVSSELVDTGLLKDDDNAVTNGTQIYVYLGTQMDNGYYLAEFRSNMAGEADIEVPIANGASAYVSVSHDAEAGVGGGHLVSFDHDGADKTQRFQASIAADAFLQLSDGTWLRINAASSGGIAVRVDDDAANPYEALRFVSPSNADVAFSTLPSAHPEANGSIAAGAGVPVLSEIGASGLVGLKVEAVGDDIRHLMEIPNDWDRQHPIYVRAVWATAHTNIAHTATWKFLYDVLIPGASSIAAPATGLDIALAEDAPAGVANALQQTSPGKINRKRLGDNAQFISFLCELDAKHASLTGDVYLLGVEFEYTPKLGSVSQPHEARDWNNTISV